MKNDYLCLSSRGDQKTTIPFDLKSSSVFLERELVHIFSEMMRSEIRFIVFICPRGSKIINPVGGNQGGGWEGGGGQGPGRAQLWFLPVSPRYLLHRRAMGPIWPRRLLGSQTMYMPMYHIPCTMHRVPCAVHRVPYHVPCTVYRVPCTMW